MTQTLRPSVLGVISLISFWFPSLVMALRPGSRSFRYPPYDSGENGLNINVFDTVVVEWEADTNIHWLSLLCDQIPWFSKNVVSSGTTTYTPSIQSNISRNWTDPLTCRFVLSEESPTQDPLSGLWSVEGASVVIGPKISITSSDKPNTTTFARTFTSTGISTTTTSPQTPTTPLSPIHSPESPHDQFPFTALTRRDSSQDSGLSAGTRVGIAIGVVLSVILVLGLGFLYYRNNTKIKSRNARWAETRNDGDGPDGVVGLQNGGTVEAARYVELDEMNGGARVAREGAGDKRGGRETQ